MERILSIQVSRCDNRRKFFLMILQLITTMVFLFALTTSFAQAVSQQKLTTVQLTWSAQIPAPDHYRIEIRKSEGNELSAPIYEYSLQNVCSLPVQPDSEYHFRIQTVTAYGELSSYSEELTINAPETGRIVSTGSNDQTIPSEFRVLQNQPNPFNASTTISFSLPVQKNVKVCVFNITGQKVSTLQDAILPAGVHSIIWDASSFPSGSYFYTVIAGDNRITKKMMLLK